MNISTKQKHILSTLINEMNERRNDFVMNPDKDFSRNRKLPFDVIIKFILCMEAGSLKDEILSFFGIENDYPSSSAFIQQRSKIKVEAFTFLFHAFNDTIDYNQFTYRGYRLFAVDGDTVPISYDPNDEETYIDQKNAKGHNAFHLNASYDILAHMYQDVIIQGEAKMNENQAFNELVERYKGIQSIFIADRGYESFNSFEYVIQSGNKFLIRVKDIHSKTSIARSFDLPDCEFDMQVKRILTRRNTNEVKNHPEIYKFMPQNQRFDFFEDKKYYEFKCRAVRFKITEDTYETIFTNLDEEEFPVEEIKKLYHLRWSIETSFRELKYAVGLLAFHSKNRASILQEIYARLLFFNFSGNIISNVKPKESKRKRKHVYQINFTRAFHIIKRFFRLKKGDIESPDIESIIAKEIEPVRQGRSSPRKLRTKTPVYFIYRLQ